MVLSILYQLFYINYLRTGGSGRHSQRDVGNEENSGRNYPEPFICMSSREVLPLFPPLKTKLYI
ncbi:hypothetical protein SAMN06265219_109109 [Gracilimonas mengyeensis]|uniref:Uncharacterized protein n=1 Tax=Gracilimonas mengyeensis TaxID=1302730 RepID=A0A521DV99_9BACT|nr:hypothetical protein SAMN06265219_109109 [Gracilimonas mengyeensis]